MLPSPLPSAKRLVRRKNLVDSQFYVGVHALSFNSSGYQLYDDV
jgi:hypothetical protein